MGQRGAGCSLPTQWRGERRGGRPQDGKGKQYQGALLLASNKVKFLKAQRSSGLTDTVRSDVADAQDEVCNIRRQLHARQISAKFTPRHLLNIVLNILVWRRRFKFFLKEE